MHKITFEQEYIQLTQNLIKLLLFIPNGKLYSKPFVSKHYVKVLSCGELIVHISGSIEYMCNGILCNFWDHAAEWTLRETLPDIKSIEDYLLEVEKLLLKLFSQIQDEDLSKQLSFPRNTTLEKLLLQTLLHSIHHRGQLYSYIHLFQEEKLPPIPKIF